MKTLIYILILFPFIGFCQFHITGGVVDVSERRDGNTMVWEVGYTQIFESRLGITANFRSTTMNLDNYYTAELILKNRIEQKGYRLDLGVGGGYNFDDYDIHPVATIENQFRLDEGVWLMVALDGVYRDSKDILKEGYRFETYLMVGLVLDVKWQRKLRKMKRFF